MTDTPDSNNPDKVQCTQCKRYIYKEVVAVLINEQDPLCIECDAYLQDLMMEEQERYVEITKEMASDAGMPEIEGQIMRW